MDGRDLKAYSEPAEASERTLPMKQFLGFLDALHHLALHYPGGGDPSDLVLGYLRHEEQGAYHWRALLGPVDQGFVAHVGHAGLRPIRSFLDPVFAVAYKTAHFGAAVTGVYRYGRPTEDDFNRGDLTGWGGDWISFYAEWCRDTEDGRNGRRFCREMLARPHRRSTFMLSELVEDADAYNTGVLLREGASLPAALRTAVSGSRLGQFHADRFGDDDDLACAVAGELLLDGDDAVVTIGRLNLIQSIGGLFTPLPGMLPRQSVNDLCRGFADTLRSSIEHEKALLASRPAD